jgi:hypothetical protein
MQLNMIKKEMEKPSFEYNADPDSAWVLYNHITLALKEAHPSTWMDDQVKMHQVFCDTFGIDIDSDTEPEEDSAGYTVADREEEIEELLPF